MTLPPWVEDNARLKMEPNEEIVEIQVLKEGFFGKLAVVQTSQRNLVVSRGLFGGRAFDIVSLGPHQSAAPVGTADDLTTIKGIGKVRSEELAKLGITTFEGLADADGLKLASSLGVSAETVKGWQRAAQKV